jgi:hypothetical protein
VVKLGLQMYDHVIANVVAYICLTIRWHDLQNRPGMMGELDCGTIQGKSVGKQEHKQECKQDCKLRVCSI